MLQRPEKLDEPGLQGKIHTYLEINSSMDIAFMSIVGIDLGVNYNGISLPNEIADGVLDNVLDVFDLDGSRQEIEP